MDAFLEVAVALVQSGLDARGEIVRDVADSRFDTVPEFFDILNHPNFGVGQQAYLMSTTSTLTPLNANYNLINTPAAYEPPDPATNSGGGAICNPSGNPTAAVVGPCYVGSTAAGSAGSYREIQFAVKLNF